MAALTKPRRRNERFGQEERRAVLMELVATEGYCSAAELSRRLSVSEMTIRRDIKEIADRGLARSVYGGITTLQDVSLSDAEFSMRAALSVEQKRRIAQEAVTAVPPASTIALDAGTTIAELALVLPSDEGLTAVTASLPVMSLLAPEPGIRLVALGGTFHTETQSFAGEGTYDQALLRETDVFFLAASAVRNDRIYCRSYFDAEIKRALISRARRTIVLTDSSKFGAPATVMVTHLDSVSLVITDNRRPDEVHQHAGSSDTAQGRLEVLQLGPGRTSETPTTSAGLPDEPSVAPANYRRRPRTGETA